MNCPKCGRSGIPSTARWCGRCGSKLPRTNRRVRDFAVGIVATLFVIGLYSGVYKWSELQAPHPLAPSTATTPAVPAAAITPVTPAFAELSKDQVTECQKESEIVHFITVDRDAGISESDESDKFKSPPIVDAWAPRATLNFHGIPLDSSHVYTSRETVPSIYGDYPDLTGTGRWKHWTASKADQDIPSRNNPEENKDLALRNCMINAEASNKTKEWYEEQKELRDASVKCDDNRHKRCWSEAYATYPPEGIVTGPPFPPNHEILRGQLFNKCLNDLAAKNGASADGRQFRPFPVALLFDYGVVSPFRRSSGQVHFRHLGNPCAY